MSFGHVYFYINNYLKIGHDAKRLGTTVIDW